MTAAFRYPEIERHGPGGQQSERRLGASRESDILHSFKGDAYWVSYFENRVPQRKMLLYSPVLRRGIKAGAEIYTITTGGLLTLRAPLPRIESDSPSPTATW